MEYLGCRYDEKKISIYSCYIKVENLKTMRSIIDWLYYYILLILCLIITSGAHRVFSSLYFKHVIRFAYMTSLLE